MSGVSTLGQALAQLERIKDQQSLFSTLSAQLASGKKSTDFKGLGNDVLVSKRARADLSSVDGYINNIVTADRRMKEMLGAVKEFKAQSKILSSLLIGLSQESAHQKGDVIYYDDPLTATVENTPVGYTSDEPDVDFETMQRVAGNLFSFLKELVNSKEEDRYLFAGADTATKPLGSTNLLDSAVSDLLGKWRNGTITNDQLLSDLTDRDSSASNPDAINDTTIGYSSTLSADNAGRVFVRVADTSEVEYTALGNDNAFRDLIVATAFIASADLGPIADAYVPPNSYPGVPDTQGAPGATIDDMKENFFAVFSGVMRMVESAIQDLDSIEFNLESSRARIDEIKQTHTQAKNFLQTTISDVEDVDMNEVAVKINTLQISLDASFRITARLQELSLTNYLG